MNKDKKPVLIAEVKTKSPFGFESSKTWEYLFGVANSFGDIISIHTDVRWGGSFEVLRLARKLTNKPILAKGIHKTDAEINLAIECGADFVLVVGRIPLVHLDKVLVEVNSLKELALLPSNLRAVWNSRDLNTGGLKSETFQMARKIFSGWLCQASNIADKKDVEEGADAILVGTSLEEYISSTGVI